MIAGWVAFVQALKILCQGPPVGDHAEVFVHGRRLFDHPIIDRGNGCSFARNLGRHALSDLAGGAVVDEHAELGLTQHIDEARGHDEVGGVDAGPGRCCAQIADRFDPVALNPDVAAKPGGAGAVDDASVGDDDVEIRPGGCLRMRARGHAESA